MRVLTIFLLLFLLFHSSCTTINNTQNNIPTHSKDTTSAYTILKSGSMIILSLKSTSIPKDAKYMEVVFGRSYYGYYSVDANIYLEKFTGTKKLILLFCDKNGKSLNLKNEFTLTQ